MKKLFAGIWHIFNTFKKIVLNLIFFTFLILFVVLISSGKEEVIVPQNTALVLNLYGDIVEQKQYVDPMDAFMAEALGRKEENPEILLSNILDVIETAKSDDRISLLVLHLQNLDRTGLSKLQEIGSALSDFKSSGKQIIALGDFYSQTQYYLASYADDIWLNKKGYLLLDGFGRYQLYFKSALEKLAISQHIFRVGTFKSAVEPYIRDDMSDEAKEANKLWLNDLWAQYKQDVAEQRNIKLNDFDETTDALLTKFKASKGSFAEYALNNHWVDALKTREEMRNDIIDIVGKNDHGDSFKQIGFKEYLTSLTTESPFSSSKDKVGIIVAQGEILDGNKAPGLIGGDSTARLLREARYADNVKAVVLRVDSPGGSAYASEIIRQEVDLLKAAGKPVIASMGNVAASGGYWISTSADKIYASPTTITGSIGIFGMMMTFENSLSKLGIYTDGVGTTELAGFGITRPMTDGMSELFQTSINRGYQDFISLVSEHRNMSLEEVDAIAQGRVWSGMKAKELGLVDELGNLNDAVLAAASLAELDDFETEIIEQEQSAQDKLLQSLLGGSASYLTPVIENNTGPATKLLKNLSNEIKRLDRFNDPQGIYSFCLTCGTF
ncbi:signal peptide peptidase SppA [Thalassotalea atypica]|uniref:signal peptide peptidase SppA n=1 Tax=Thalassotalea atypica TaxID=2054316 RepID=UPI0025732C54|nr:signal peptide peptidase SppA [Thalassotalea atypica]